MNAILMLEGLFPSFILVLMLYGVHNFDRMMRVRSVRVALACCGHQVRQAATRQSPRGEQYKAGGENVGRLKTICG